MVNTPKLLISGNLNKGEKVRVWEDEVTGVLCRVSYLIGIWTGFVAIPPGHPWFMVSEIPIPKVQSYGEVHWPKECEGLWWVYFYGAKGEGLEEVEQRCRILAAQVEIAGTDLAQQIDSLPMPPPLRSEKQSYSMKKKMKEVIDWYNELEEDFDYFKIQSHSEHPPRRPRIQNIPT